MTDRENRGFEVTGNQSLERYLLTPVIVFDFDHGFNRLKERYPHHLIYSANNLFPDMALKMERYFQIIAAYVSGITNKLIETFRLLRENEDMGKLLGIPFLFRMIVHSRFDEISTNPVELYDKLVDHLMEKREIRGNDLQQVIAELCGLSYDIYCNDTDTAIIEDDKSKDKWIVAFYIKQIEKGRFAFFHRSFYQYFLARYILYHILDIVTDKQAEDFIGLFAERELDDTVRQYLSLMSNEENKKAIHNNLKLVIEVLVETEAYLNLEPKYHDGNAEKTKFGRTTNVYRNALHISAAFSYVIEKPFQDGLDFFIRTYHSNFIKIYSAEIRADLNGANLSRADLSGADLRGADLRGANLIGAKLNGTNLDGANLKGADLSGADLSGVNLSRANLSGAYLNGTNLSGTNLSGANLRRANLRGTNLNVTNLIEAKLSGAILIEANMVIADLSRANLSEANLSGASLNGTNLSGADLSGANLSRANLIETDLSGANVNRANLSRAILNRANLSGTILSRADLSGIILIGANLNRANLSGTGLIEANLSGANLIGANVIGANLIGANLSGANLTGADLSRADLRVKHISRMIIDSNKKEFIDPSIEGYGTIVWVS